MALAAAAEPRNLRRAARRLRGRPAAGRDVLALAAVDHLDRAVGRRGQGGVVDHLLRAADRGLGGGHQALLLLDAVRPVRRTGREAVLSRDRAGLRAGHGDLTGRRVDLLLLLGRDEQGLVRLDLLLRRGDRGLRGEDLRTGGGVARTGGCGQLGVQLGQGGLCTRRIAGLQLGQRLLGERGGRGAAARGVAGRRLAGGLQSLEGTLGLILGVVVGRQLGVGPADRRVVGGGGGGDLRPRRRHDRVGLVHRVLGPGHGGRGDQPVEPGHLCRQTALGLGQRGLGRGRVDRRQHLAGVHLVADPDLDRGQLAAGRETEILGADRGQCAAGRDAVGDVGAY